MTSSENALIEGLDISNLQGPAAMYRNAALYQAADFVIVQAIPRPRPNGLTGDQLRAALADGKHLGIYTWMWHDPTWRLDPDPRQDQLLRLATVPDDVPLHMRPWLDEEDDQSAGWKNVTVAQRKDDVLRSLEVLSEWAVKRGLPQAGIYWSRYFIDILFDGDDGWLPAGTVQWLAHYGIAPGSLISGAVVAHQFTSTPLDRDMMLASEIVTQEADVLIPDDVVTKFHLADNHDVTGLIANYEGVLTTVRQIAFAEGQAQGADAQSKLDQIKQIVAA